MPDIQNALQKIIIPYLQADLVSSKCLKNVQVNEDSVVLDIVLGFPAQCFKTELTAFLQAALKDLLGQRTLACEITSKIVARRAQAGIAAIPGVKNIIAIASGKGGVGKSTTAVNLAVALLQAGARVGILDADIYGPNQPHMLGAMEKPESPDGKHMLPVVSHGVQSMSIGYLIDIETPMIWRGPMVTSALQQLLNETQWNELDYLIIDLPPGTGDIQLTMAQKMPVAGAVIVSTPQDIALLDARKAVKMFEKVNVPILGLIENMSLHICSHCGTVEHIFGHGGAAKMAAEHHLHFLGELPLHKQIRALADQGLPIVAAEPEGEIAGRYRAIALQIAAKLASQPQNYSSKFPSVVVENK